LSSAKVNVRFANTSDISTIQHIASVTWPVAYVDILSPRQMSYMLNLMYHHEVLKKQMEEQGHLFFIAEQDGKALGFAGVSPENYQFPADKNAKEGAKVWKLHKLYVLPAAQKLGVGKSLMNTIEETVKKSGGNYLILNVNRKNPAYQYYLKKGFEVLESGDFDIGSGFYMNDYVMGIHL
jgi:GNAT superfamily N-acetyltransferase